MPRSSLLSVAALLGLATPAAADTALNTLFGPTGAGGAFYTIVPPPPHSPVNDTPTPLAMWARAVRTDTNKHVWVLQDMRDGGDLDCGLQRFLFNGVVHDMDFAFDATPPATKRSVEATHRLWWDVGGLDDDQCNALAITNEQDAYVFGTATRAAGRTTGAIARVTSDGWPDSTFSSDGKVTLSQLGVGGYTTLDDGIALDDGSVVACGTRTRTNATTGAITDQDMIVVKVTPSGVLDTSFSDDGWIELGVDASGNARDTCAAVMQLPTGKFVVAGSHMPSHSSDARFLTYRLAANGALDGSFGFFGSVQTDVDAAGTNAADNVRDLAYDATLERLYVVGDSTGTTNPGRGLVIALDGSGELVPAFANDGIRAFRFHDADPSRGWGDTLPVRATVVGSTLYVVGDHVNTTAVQGSYAMYDVGIAALRPDGEFETTYDGDGASYSSFNLATYDGLGHQLQVNERVADLDVRGGRLTLAFTANRYPHVAGVTPAVGPLAPGLAQVALTPQADPPGFIGIAPPDMADGPTIALPGTFGRYCSVRNVGTGIWDARIGTVSTDPCAVLLAQIPGGVIQRQGIYSRTAENQALITCQFDIFGSPFRGTGSAAFTAAKAAGAGKNHCVLTMAPMEMPVFRRPYRGAHPPAMDRVFSHANPIISDPAAQIVRVTDFGHDPDDATDHEWAHALDRFGRQWCYFDDAGVHQPNNMNEMAYDFGNPEDQPIAATAAGIVLQAVPRYVIGANQWQYSEPWQREVFIGHKVGSGDYVEMFWSYYAHQKDTRVQVGQIVAAQDVLGLTGRTGSVKGNWHMHFATGKMTNLSYRRSFEFDFHRRSFGDITAIVAMFDPYGWKATEGHDPWAYRWPSYNPFFPLSYGFAGVFSIDLWKHNVNGVDEAPPTSGPTF
jgi:uncharacterized delta-60 repeat protein